MSSTPPTLTSLAIEPAITTLFEVGATQQLKVTGTYSDNSIKDLSAPSTGTTFVSDKSAIATVDANGLVTAGTARGTAIITATNNLVSASAKIEVDIDTTPPVITITEPLDGATVSTPQVTVKGKITDDSPIQSAAINGASLPLNNDSFSASVALSQGSNTITVTAEDIHGNKGSSSITVIYQPPPTLLSLSIEPAVITLSKVGATQQLKVTGIYSDNSTNNLTAPSAGTTYVSDKSAIATVDANGLVTAGTTKGTAIITATNNLVSATAKIEVNIDTTPPVIAITEPLDGATVSTPQVTVKGTITDDSPIQSAAINGASLTLNNDSFSASLALSQGSNTITVTAEDIHGNKGSSSITVICQPPPTLTSLAIEPAVITLSEVGATQQLKVTGTYSDNSTKDLTAPSIGTTYVSDKSAIATVDANGLVTAGTTKGTAIITATNNLVSASAKIEVDIDTTPPVITITEPLDGATVSTPQVTVKGKITDDSPIQRAAINGAPLTLSSINFNEVVDLIQGPNPITVTATDIHGNNGSAKIIVTYQPPPPTIISLAIEPPAATLTTNGATIQLKVTGTYSDTTIKDLTATSTGTTYESDNSAIASVDANGLVTAGATNGTAIIAATNTNISATAKITVELPIDNRPPAVTITAPSDGAIVSTPQVTVMGTIVDESPLKDFNINGTPLTLNGINFTASVMLQEGKNVITVAASDEFDNHGAASISVTYVVEQVDTTPPLIKIITPPSGAKLKDAQITVNGTIQDASSIDNMTVNSASATLNGSEFSAQLTLQEGGNIVIAKATDAFGNEGSDSVTVTLDTTPPPLSVTPLPPLTNKPDIVVTGVTEPGATITITGGSTTATGSADVVTGDFSIKTELLLDVVNTLSVTAVDELGNSSAPQQPTILQDSTPPSVTAVLPTAGITVPSPNSICQLSFSEPVDPATVNLGTSFLVTAAGALVSGNMQLSQNNQLATFTPSGPLPLASTIVVAAVPTITDIAGNHLTDPFASEFFTPQGVGASVAAGEIYDDTLGLPMAGATARLIVSNGVPMGDDAPAMTTDPDGLFSLEVAPGIQTVQITRPGFTTVIRQKEVYAEASVTLLDARLTPLDSKKNLLKGALGGLATNAAGDVTITFKDNSASGDIEVYLTKLSQQGLRSPLPLGWSPIVAIDVTANISQLKTPASLIFVLPASIAVLPSLVAVQWSQEHRAWKVLTPSVSSTSDGKATLAISELAPVTLVAPDEGATAPPIAQEGALLGGFSPVAYPDDITGQGLVVPAVIMAGDKVNARAAASLSLTQPMPSGTVFEAQAKESFSLTSDEMVFPQSFVQDLQFFAKPAGQAPLKLAVDFPVTPSRQFGLGELALGKVELFIRPPRAVSGFMVGKNGTTITTSDDLLVTVPAGALSRNTSLAARNVPDGTFPLSTPLDISFLGGFIVDTGGVPLATPLTVALPPLVAPETLPENAAIILVRVEDDAGIPRAFLAGLGEVIDSRVQSLEQTKGFTFPGVRQAGQYGFYLIPENVGFVQGSVLAVEGIPSTRAIVTNDTLPFLSRVDTSGNYVTIAKTGDITLTARDPVTDDIDSGNTNIPTAWEAVALELALQSTPPQVLSVTPANGATNVSVTASVAIVFSEPVTGITPDTLQVLAHGNAPVTGHFGIAGSTVTFYPDSKLASETEYTVRIKAEIHDKTGYSVINPGPFSFTTVDLRPPVSTGNLSLSLPDARGYATVTGSAGAAEPHSMVYLINNTSGMVTAFTLPGGTDGSFSQKILADISDDITVTIVDASGNSTTRNPGSFKDEATGAMVVGPRGGIVQGEGGIQLDIPAGALPRAAVIRVEPVNDPFTLPPDILADPILAKAFSDSYFHVASVRIDTGGVEFISGAEISIPAPAGTLPGDNFIAVQDTELELGGEHYDAATDTLIKEPRAKARRFKLADIAIAKETQGKINITTASPPFPGILGTGIIQFMGVRVAAAVVSGKVVRNVMDSSGNIVSTSPVKKAVVRLAGNDDAQIYYAETKDDGTFVLSSTMLVKMQNPRELTLLVTDPLSAIIQKRSVPIVLQANPFAQTYPQWNIIVAAVLREDFVLVSEERIRQDVTPPVIDIRFSAATLVNNVVEEGNDLTIDIQASDNRDLHPLIEEITINDVPTFIGVQNTYQHVIPAMQSGLYFIKVTASDHASPANKATLQKTIMVRKPGGVPGAVEGPPQLLAYSLEYVGEAKDVVDIKSKIVVNFNEPLDTTTVTPTTYLIRDVATGTAVTGRFVFTNFDSTITFVPDNLLQYGTDYEILIAGGSSGVLDTEGLPVNTAPILFKTSIPPVIGEYSITDAKDLAVQGTKAFVTDSNKADPTGLTIVDFPEPDVSTLLSKLQLRPDAYSSYAVSVSGNYAYVITVGGVIPNTFTLLSTLQKWDITDLANPVKVAWTQLTTTTTLAGVIPMRLVVSEGFVFVAMLNSGFKIFDASSLAAVQPVDFVDPKAGSGQAGDIAVLGDYAYVANGLTGELVIVKFTNANGQIGLGYEVTSRVAIPGSIPGAAVNAYRVKLVQNLLVRDGSNIRYMNLAFVGCLEQGVAVVDVTDPAHPRHLTTLNPGGRVIGLDVDPEQGIVAVSDSSAGLRLLNIKDMEYLPLVSGDPVGARFFLLGTIPLFGAPKGGGVVIQDNLVYLTTSHGVEVVDLAKNDSCRVKRVYIEDGQHKLDLMPGNIVTAKAVTTPADLPVVWTIEEREPGVKASIDQDSGILSVDENSGKGDIRIRATDKKESSCFKETMLSIGKCPNCGDGGSCPITGGKGTCTISRSIDVQINLGLAQGGLSAGQFFLRAKEPSPFLSNPSALFFSTHARDVEIMYGDGGVIRQALSPNALADVVVQGPYSYEIRFYKQADVGNKGTDGSYSIKSGASPFTVWRISNPDNSKTINNRLTVTENQGGSVRGHEYVYDSAAKDWSLVKGGLVKEKNITTYDSTGLKRTVAHTVEDTQGNLASRESVTYQRFPWGEDPVEEIQDPGGAALTTSTTYYEDPALAGYRQVKSKTFPDGSWVRYAYDTAGRMVQEVRPWLDSPATAADSAARITTYDYQAVDANDAGVKIDEKRARQVVEQIQGVVVGRTYYSFRVNGQGERVEIVERAASPAAQYGAAGNERTVTTFYPAGTDFADSGRLKSVLYPDGRLDTYTHQFGSFNTGGNPALSNFAYGTGKKRREMIIHGTADHPEGLALQTTRETTVYNESGRMVWQETAVYDGRDYQRIDWTAYSHDEFGHTVQVSRANGAQTDTVWSCCGKTEETDPRGITKRFDYDALQRLTSETKEGVASGPWPSQGDITTSYTYDAAGRRLMQTVSGSDGLSQTTRTAYDLAGRMKSQTDPAGLVTSHDYASGGRVTTLTRPGNATEVTTNHLDGQVRNLTGTGALAQYHEYGVNQDGTRWTKVYAGSVDSPRWEKTTTDALGRTVKTEKPGYAEVETTEFFYNSRGQLARTRAPGQADTIQVYDDLGNQVRTGLDVDGNLTLAESSQDRITETRSAYALIGADWWREESQRVFAAAGSTKPTTVATNRTRLTGLGTAGLTEEAVAIDIHGNATVSRASIDRAAKVETRVTDFPDATNDAVSITLNGLAVENRSKSGVRTTFAYDSLARQTGVTDPRIGTSITSYNAKGQVEFVQDPAGNRTRYAYDPATGRKVADIDALEKTTRYAHNSLGMLTHTWGDGAYPVKYEYDQYGQQVKMSTFRAGTGWDRAQWPADTQGTPDVTTWRFHEPSGLLLAKEDAAGSAVAYAYTLGGKLATRAWARAAADGKPLATSYRYIPATGELAAIDYADATPDVSFTYDRLGRPQRVVDGAGSHVFAYNAGLQLESETLAGLQDAVITRTYNTGDLPGRSTGFTVGSGYTVGYGYEPATGRFATVSWDIGAKTDRAAYAYLPDSDLLQGLVTESGQATTYGYEPHRNLRTLVKNEFRGALLSSYGYTVDELGRRIAVANSGQAFAENAFNRYGYNSRDELTESSRYLGDNANDTTRPVASEYRKYEYDTIGNRKKATDWDKAQAVRKQLTYAANQLNQYELVTADAGKPVAENLGYDRDGNLTSVVTTEGTTRYTFDAENRLVAVEAESPIEGSVKAEFSYDFMSRRVAKKTSVFAGGSWTPGIDSVYFYDGWNLVREARTDHATLGTDTRFYVWGLDLSQSLQGAGGVGGLLAMADGSGEMYLYSYDGNGNVGALVDGGSGTIAAKYEYDPYGNVLIGQGAIAQENSYRFSTKYQDDETGLVYYGLRYYLPGLGKWLNVDPGGEGKSINLYQFLRNNAISLIDAYGLKAYNVGSSDPSPLPVGRLNEGGYASIPGNPGMLFAKLAIQENWLYLYLLYPDATLHLLHYLGNSGKTYSIRFEKMVDDVPRVQNLFNSELDEAQKFVEGLSPGKHEIMSSELSKEYSYEIRNWQMAVGDYWAWGKGVATVCGKDAFGGARWAYSLDFEYKLHDPYDWHEDKAPGFSFLGYDFTDEFMRKFHLVGYGKEFLMTGSFKKTVKWNPGVDEIILK